MLAAIHVDQEGGFSRLGVDDAEHHVGDKGQDGGASRGNAVLREKEIKLGKRTPDAIARLERIGVAGEGGRVVGIIISLSLGAVTEAETETGIAD